MIYRIKRDQEQWLRENSIESLKENEYLQEGDIIHVAEDRNFYKIVTKETNIPLLNSLYAELIPYDLGLDNIDASKITSGVLDIARIPQSALERCVVVENDTARFKLTKEQIQIGDSVKVTSPDNLMYIVVDDTKLNSEEGYVSYSAAVKWDTIKDKPSSFPPAAHNQDWSTITNKPDSFTPSSHNHEGVYQPVGDYALKNHNHTASDIGTYTISQIDEKLKSKSDTTHKHTAEQVGAYTKQEIDNKIDDINNKLENYTAKKYGVKFSGSNPVGIRTFDAVGLVANVGVDDEEVQNDFDNISFYNRPVCCGYHDSKGNFIVNAYEGEPGFKRDGSNGEVYYECTPFYWNQSYEEPVVSALPFEGAILAPMFKSENKKVYLPCYWASTVNDKYVSRSGLYPTWSSLNNHMAMCKKTNANAHTETIVAHMCEYVLQLVEFATKDLQTIMMGSCNHIWERDTHVVTIATTNQNYVIMSKERAKDYVIGQTIVTSSNWNSQRTITRIVDYDSNNSAIYFEGQSTISASAGAKVSTFSYKTGATDNVKASSGSNVSNTDGKHQCKWRGKEAPWADSFSGLCDILKVIENGNHNIYWLQDPKKYTGALTGDYVKLNYTVPTSDGYAKFLGVDKRYPFAAITKEIGADSVTYLSAYYWNDNDTPAVAIVGGDWHIGRNCSPVYFDLYAAPSSSGVSRLARLFVTPI